jgi:hypothetical protein
LFCPQCRTEYVEGVYECADCRIPLVYELPAGIQVSPVPVDPGSNLVAVMETGDSYDFLTAANALRDAGIPYTGDESYTGEFLVGRRVQAPYVWTLLVPEERAEEASKVIDSEKVNGPAAPQLMVPDTTPREYSLNEKILLLAVSLLLLCGVVLMLRK